MNIFISSKIAYTNMQMYTIRFSDKVYAFSNFGMNTYIICTMYYCIILLEYIHLIIIWTIIGCHHFYCPAATDAAADDDVRFQILLVSKLLQIIRDKEYRKKKNCVLNGGYCVYIERAMQHNASIILLVQAYILIVYYFINTLLAIFINAHINLKMGKTL